MSRVERVAVHVGQIHALLQCIVNECDAAQTEVFDHLNMSDAANKQSEKLKTENTKLRELVQEMYTTIRSNNSWWDWACKDTKCFAERMHELGVEVQP